MHNTSKIRLFRILLRLSWIPSLIFVYPLALFRRRLSGKHVFFFDRYSLGGAQRVHLDILNSIGDLPKLVLFTRLSPDQVMKPDFDRVPNAENQDIHFYCDNLLIRLFTVHYWAFYLNKHRNLTVFSSNSTFFYDLLPWLRKDFQRMELLHNFTYGNKGMEFFGLANYEFLNRRLVVDHYTAQNIRDQYQSGGVPVQFSEKIQVIEPGVDLPDSKSEKDPAPLRILYAGRATEQKRVWLINRIAEHIYKEQWPVEFHFAGHAENDLSADVMQKSVMHGSISNRETMQDLYKKTHVILLTSAYEGFPMVIKEGMAQGCIPMVTALPGNLTHLINEKNALLIESVSDENAVVKEAIIHIRHLLDDPEFRIRLSDSAFEYAQKNFGKCHFVKAYRALLSAKS